MRKVTKSELELLTGKHGKFIKQALAGIPFERGPNRSHQYDSARALSAIYGARGRSLEEARTKQAETAARLNEIRAEELSKTRIPIQIVHDVMDEIFQSLAATIKLRRVKRSPSS
jgi:hypothetical protein